MSLWIRIIYAFDKFGKPKYVETWNKSKPQPDGVVGSKQEFKYSEDFIGRNDYEGLL